jgi:hypothetical protein
LTKDSPAVAASESWGENTDFLVKDSNNNNNNNNNNNKEHLQHQHMHIEKDDFCAKDDTHLVIDTQLAGGGKFWRLCLPCQRELQQLEILIHLLQLGYFSFGYDFDDHLASDDVKNISFANCFEVEEDEVGVRGFFRKLRRRWRRRRHGWNQHEQQQEVGVGGDLEGVDTTRRDVKEGFARMIWLAAAQRHLRVLSFLIHLELCGGLGELMDLAEQDWEEKSGEYLSAFVSDGGTFTKQNEDPVTKCVYYILKEGKFHSPDSKSAHSSLPSSASLSSSFQPFSNLPSANFSNPQKPHPWLLKGKLLLHTIQRKKYPVSKLLAQLSGALQPIQHPQKSFKHAIHHFDFKILKLFSHHRSKLMTEETYIHLLKKSLWFHMFLGYCPRHLKLLNIGMDLLNISEPEFEQMCQEYLVGSFVELGYLKGLKRLWFEHGIQMAGQESSSLFSAVMMGRVKIVKFLISGGGDRDVFDAGILASGGSHGSDGVGINLEGRPPPGPNVPITPLFTRPRFATMIAVTLLHLLLHSWLFYNLFTVTACILCWSQAYEFTRKFPNIPPQQAYSVSRLLKWNSSTVEQVPWMVASPTLYYNETSASLPSSIYKPSTTRLLIPRRPNITSGLHTDTAAWDLVEIPSDSWCSEQTGTTLLDWAYISKWWSVVALLVFTVGFLYRCLNFVGMCVGVWVVGKAYWDRERREIRRRRIRENEGEVR